MVISGIKVNNEATFSCTGAITNVNDTEVTIRMTSRMGILKVPLRLVISNNYPKEGDKVKFLMSLIEVKNDNEKEEK